MVEAVERFGNRSFYSILNSATSHLSRVYIVRNTSNSSSLVCIDDGMLSLHVDIIVGLAASMSGTNT